jgi:hypothetical protein
VFDLGLVEDYTIGFGFGAETEGYPFGTGWVVGWGGGSNTEELVC